MRATIVHCVGHLRRWLGAIPLAWRADALFRWAALAAAACLAALLGGRGDNAVVPAAAPGPPLPPPATGAALAARNTAPPPAVPPIAPGRPLDGVVVLPAAPDADRFGRTPARP